MKVEPSDLIRKGDSNNAAKYQCADYECKRCKAKIQVPLDVDFEERDGYATREHECKAP